MSDALKPGMTVKLKSGGPLMTITWINKEGQAGCTWFSADGKSQKGVFPVEALVADDGP